jgi:hypothetical protein
VHAAARKASPALTDPSLNCRAEIVSWWLRQHRASPGSATELSAQALSDHGNEVSRRWHESPACLYLSAMWLPATFRAVSCIILQLVLRGHRTGARLHGYLRIQTRGIYHTAMPPVGDIAGSGKQIPSTVLVSQPKNIELTLTCDRSCEIRDRATTCRWNQRGSLCERRRVDQHCVDHVNVTQCGIPDSRIITSLSTDGDAIWDSLRLRRRTPDC